MGTEYLLFYIAYSNCCLQYGSHEYICLRYYMVVMSMHIIYILRCNMAVMIIYLAKV